MINLHVKYDTENDRNCTTYKHERYPTCRLRDKVDLIADENYGTAVYFKLHCMGPKNTYISKKHICKSGTITIYTDNSKDEQFGT